MKPRRLTKVQRAELADILKRIEPDARGAVVDTLAGIAAHWLERNPSPKQGTARADVSAWASKVEGAAAELAALLDSPPEPNRNAMRDADRASGAQYPATGRVIDDARPVLYRLRVAATAVRAECARPGPDNEHGEAFVATLASAWLACGLGAPTPTNAFARFAAELGRANGVNANARTIRGALTRTIRPAAQGDL